MNFEDNDVRDPAVKTARVSSPFYYASVPPKGMLWASLCFQQPLQTTQRALSVRSEPIRCRETTAPLSQRCGEGGSGL